MKKTVVFTLGTSNRKIEEFCQILKEFKITLVADIRRWPKSKFPWFEKENLKKTLKKEKIKYFHFEKLGGYRGGYEKYMKTKEFKKAFQKLKNLCQKEKVAIVCAEKFPWRCHRRFVAEALKREGFLVIHIIEKDKIWQKKK